MIRNGYRGNTLAEYALILALVGVAGLGALSLFGQSTSNLLVSASDGENHKNMMRLVSLDFGSNGSKSGSAPGSSSPSGSLPPVNLRLVESGSGGINVSSAEGNRVNIPNAPDTFNASLTTAQSFEQLANKASNPATADLFRRIADESYFLAVAQASFEIVGKGSDNKYMKSVSKVIDEIEGSSTSKMMTSLKGIDDWTNMLAIRKVQIENTPDLSPADKQAALLMLDVTVSKSNQYYGNILKQNPNYQDAESIAPPATDSKEMIELRRLALTASTDKVLDDNQAIDASVETGVNLDSMSQGSK